MEGHLKISCTVPLVLKQYIECPFLTFSVNCIKQSYLCLVYESLLFLSLSTLHLECVELFTFCRNLNKNLNKNLNNCSGAKLCGKMSANLKNINRSRLSFEGAECGLENLFFGRRRGRGVV